jgi:putative hydrolase of the HAD superfamily
VTDGIHIRPACAADSGLILAFLGKKAAFDRSTGAFAGALGTNDERIRATLFGERPFAQALLAEVDGEPRGFALFYFRYSSFAGRPSLWLDDLYVDEAARGRGAGAALMTELVRIAVAHDCTHAGWTASVNNPRGVAFYQRLGATIVGRDDPHVTLRLELPEVRVARSGERRAAPLRWVLFDWGNTLMSEDGPVDIPMGLWPEVRAIDGAFAVLATLAQRHRIAIATNASVSDRAMIVRALERVSLRAFVSEVFCYRELGYRKSEPAFWNAVIARLGVGRDEILMVGDDLEQDVLAPRRYGIATVWLKRVGAELPPGSDVHAIERLAELPAMIATDTAAGSPST